MSHILVISEIEVEKELFNFLFLFCTHLIVEKFHLEMSNFGICWPLMNNDEKACQAYIIVQLLELRFCLYQRNILLGNEQLESSILVQRHKAIIGKTQTNRRKDFVLIILQKVKVTGTVMQVIVSCYPGSLPSVSNLNLERQVLHYLKRKT